MKPVVSVRIMAYQNAPYIRECIDSVLMQKTDFPFEICIGEDGSTDGTREICLEYQEKYSEIVRVFLWDRDLPEHKVLPPPTYNFINTIKRCKGEFIAILDGDDYWTDPLRLQKQVDFLEKNGDYSGAFHETRVLLEDNTFGKIYGHYEKAYITPEDTLSTLSPFHISSFIFRKEHWQVPSWFYEIVSADMALFTIIASIYQYYGQNKDLVRWGDKNNYYVHHIPLLKLLFPGASFIHLIRDGRDVACSYLEVNAVVEEDAAYRPKLKDNVRTIAREWDESNKKIAEQIYGRDNLLVRFEDLVMDLKKELLRIFNFLDVHWSDEALDYYLKNDEPAFTLKWKEKTLQPIQRNVVGRYKRDLTTSQLRDFEDSARELLNKYHYC